MDVDEPTGSTQVVKKEGGLSAMTKEIIMKDGKKRFEVKKVRFCLYPLLVLIPFTICLLSPLCPFDPFDADTLSFIVERGRFVGMGFVFLGASVADTTAADYEVIHTDIVVDNCAICRNHIMDLCALYY